MSWKRWVLYFFVQAFLMFPVIVFVMVALYKQPIDLRRDFLYALAATLGVMPVAAWYLHKTGQRRETKR